MRRGPLGHVPRQALVEMRRAFLTPRLDCERLLGAPAPARPLAFAAGAPAPPPEAPGPEAPAAPEAHRELAALCVAQGYVLRFEGVEALPSGFKCVFRVEFRHQGRAVAEVFRSKRVHGAIRAAQNDAAAEALLRLRELQAAGGRR